jgi:hypothetical protein
MGCNCSQNNQGENMLPESIAALSNYPTNILNSSGNILSSIGNARSMRTDLYRPSMIAPVGGWQDLQVTDPIDPKSILVNASLGATAGSYLRSTNALQAAWVGTTLAFTGNVANTKVSSLDTTDAATTVNALQWTFARQMVNVGANIPPVLARTIFLRAGGIWDNQFEIAFGGATYNNVQLTFLQNLATSGQFLNAATGSIPVINFGNGFTGNLVMHVNLMQPGIYQMGLIMTTGGNWSVFDMEWVVLP